LTRVPFPASWSRAQLRLFRRRRQFLTCARSSARRHEGSYRNCGTSGTLIGGIANGDTLDALAIPLGSTLMLLRLPTLAAPGGMPLIKAFPVPAWPAIRANDAAGTARRRSARASFTEVFDTEDSMICQSDRNATGSRRKSPRGARKFVALCSLYVTVPIVAIVGAVSGRVSSKAAHCVLVETQTLVAATDLIPPKADATDSSTATETRHVATTAKAAASSATARFGGREQT
jgi:hypothetical protein